MTCPECGGLVKVHKDTIGIEIEGYVIRVYTVGICEFCEHTVHLACEAELKEL
jgi:C4-type Zn-finger protein